MTIPSTVETLYSLCLQGTATEQQQQEFITWAAQPQNREAAGLLVQRAMQTPGPLLAPDGETTNAIVDAIIKATQFQAGDTAARSIPFLRRWRWAAAAAVAALLIAAAWITYSARVAGHNTPVMAARDIMPGKEGAILTLSDGTKMILDSMGNGVVAMQNGARVVLKNGQLMYDDVAVANGTLLFNTVSTPRGRQFNLLLPDGTKVWLNSESAITYPISFAAERKVTVTGEAYLEVAPDKSKAFSVQARNTQIDVLGTHFNINAYSNEQTVAATLLEGSIRTSAIAADNTVTNGVMVQPGQQAQVVTTETEPAVKLIPHVEIDRIMAWKNGLFNFEDVNLASLMRQLARWYDIEVVFEKGVPDMEFGGKMSRNMKLSDVIKALREAGVNCSLEEGRRLIVHS